MPCPRRGTNRVRAGLSRRNFAKAALAIGGTSALAACLDRADDQNAPRGDANAGDRPDRLYGWNDYLPQDSHGNVALPTHQLILGLSYTADGPPTASERESVEAGFRTLDRAFQWGTGDEFDPSSTQGLLYMIGYSRAYFDRFDRDLPEALAFQAPEDLIAALEEDATADSADAVLILSSDDVEVLLEAELGLRGELDLMNGVPVEGSFDTVFDVVDRRTGFLGIGRPAEELDVEGLPADSPTAMGFRSGFSDNQASEDRVSLPPPYDEYTTMQLSRLVFGLEEWYENEEADRVSMMFSPEHDPEDVGDRGERLASRSRIDEAAVERSSEDARTHGVIGHTQKVAAARDETFVPRLLRRSEGVSTDLDEPGMNFVSLQSELEAFLEVRRAMNGRHVDADLPPAGDGIRSFVDVLRRGTYLIPSRERRSLPTPQPSDRK